MPSELERAMQSHLRVMELSHEWWPKFEQQYRFAPPRRFLFDFCSPEINLAIECEGGGFIRQVICNNCGTRVTRKLKSGYVMKVFEGGGHNTGSGMNKDMEKYNLAVQAGFLVLRYSGKMIENDAIFQIERIVAERCGKAHLLTNT